MQTPDRRRGSRSASCTSACARSSPGWSLAETDGDVLVVTHGGVIRVAEAYCSGIEPRDMAWGPVPNASVWGLSRPNPSVAVVQ